MRGAGLFRFGRDHPDIVGQRAGDGLCNRQPLRIDAVVVGNKNTQLAHFFSIFFMPM